MAVHQELSNFIWQIADLLRGPYRPPQYERVMLPLTVLRRFDCVLEKSKPLVIAEYEKYQGKLTGDALDKRLNVVAGPNFRFHNHSPLTFEALKGDPDQIDKHLADYIYAFSANVQRIFERFDFFTEIERMREANILYLVVSKFCDVDLHPERVDNIQMGLLFEDLIRRFNEQANETAGDHFTPREVIRLMVDILFAPDDALLATPNTISKLLDPACGTGGMLAEAKNYLREYHKQARLFVYGQDFNPRAYAIAASDLLIKEEDESDIRFGDSLLNDQFEGETYDYLLANPPFGVDWKKQQKDVTREHDKQGYAGRFGAGLPRVNDGSLLFLQHMIAKFQPVRPTERLDGSRLAIVFNGSPLFTGGAGSGESNIRKWIIENDWLEAIIALPEQMFYNTGIGTYVWIVTNRKEPARRGKIQLIDARARWKPMRRSLGDKRREMKAEDIAIVVREYGAFCNTPDTDTTKVFNNADFGYARVTVERPLRLRFQITLERKARFLDACPYLLDDMQALDTLLGREACADWNLIWKHAAQLLTERNSRWKAPEQKVFRDVFTVRDVHAAPVIASQEPKKANKELTQEERNAGWFAPSADIPDDAGTQLAFAALRQTKSAIRVRFEADANLRDFENVPLAEDVNAYFFREVLPHVADAWMDRDKDKTGYEINFNRHFYRYVPPRPLEDIDTELKAAEAEILRLLNEVTA